MGKIQVIEIMVQDQQLKQHLGTWWNGEFSDHLRLTESEIPCVGPECCVLANLPSDPDACPNMRTLALEDTFFIFLFH